MSVKTNFKQVLQKINKVKITGFYVIRIDLIRIEFNVFGSITVVPNLVANDEMILGHLSSSFKLLSDVKDYSKRYFEEREKFHKTIKKTSQFKQIIKQINQFLQSEKFQTTVKNRKNRERIKLRKELREKLEVYFKQAITLNMNEQYILKLFRQAAAQSVLES